MEVGEVLIGLQPEESDCLESLMKIVNEKNIKLSVLEAGMKVTLDKKCFLDVLWPIKADLISENTLNNNSLVFKLYYDEFSILFTGDIEEIAEKEIAEKYKENLKCDILKVAHHGSKTSSSQLFLKYAKPNITLIGVGKDNKFGHPSESVIRNFNAFECKIYRTDEEGEIHMKVKRNGKYKIKTKL